MSWPAAFVAALAAPVLEPRFVLRSVTLGASWEQPFTWATHRVAGADQVLVADPGRMTLRHGSVQPVSWRWSAGSLTMGLLHGVDLVGLARGQVVELLLALGPADLPDYERVWVGTLEQVAMGADRRWSVTCRALEGALTTRWLALDGDELGADPSLFREAGTTSTLTANYTAGDSTLYVADTDGASRPAGIGAIGIRVTPTTGDPFVLTAADALGTTEFIGVSSTGAMDTTPVDAVIGDTVTYLAYDEAHPADIAARVLLASGLYSAYPQTWSLGLPGHLWDQVDADAQVELATLAARTTSPAWVLAEDRPVRAASELLTSMLSSAGFWLCQRQGQLTVRAVHRLEDIPVTHVATASDIVRWSYQAFGGEVEYRGVTVSDRGSRVAGSAPATNSIDDYSPVGVWAAIHELLGGALPPVATEASESTSFGAIGGQGPRSLPSAGYHQRTLPVYGTTADRAAWRTEVALRTLNWCTRLTESITLTLRGWQWAELTAGDVIAPSWPAELLTSRRGPDDPATKGGPLLIIGGGPDYPRPTTTFQCLALPPADTE